MKRLSLVLLYLVAVAGFACIQAKDKGTKIPFEQLPVKAQTMINENYAGLKVNQAKQFDNEGIPTYFVKLSDKTQIEFDMVGSWNYIKGTKSNVPNSVYPKKMMKEFEKQFIGKRVKYVSTDGVYYDIQFRDGDKLRMTAVGDIVE